MCTQWSRFRKRRPVLGLILWWQKIVSREHFNKGSLITDTSKGSYYTMPVDMDGCLVPDTIRNIAYKDDGGQRPIAKAPLQYKYFTWAASENSLKCLLFFKVKIMYLKGIDVKKKIHGPYAIGGPKILRFFNANCASFPVPCVKWR